MNSHRFCGSEISLDTIRERLLENKTPRPQLSGNHYRPAAVLIPLVCSENKWHLLFTRRTDLVQTHKGQVSFPGGAVDQKDTDREQTALREVYEEIGVKADEIEILGRLMDMPTVTGYVITPIVGYMNWPLELKISHQEVSRVFIVPLDWLNRIENRIEKDMMVPEGRRKNVVFFNPYEGERIWGATARLTLNLLHSIS